MSASTALRALDPAANSARFQHPFDIDQLVSASDAITMVGRALNCVDARLVDHGLRVARLFDAMLAADGSVEAYELERLRLVALLHDVGAYRTEEIEQLVAFETGEVWEHSFYGYLFFKELSPLADYAEVVLYHHMPDRLFTDQDERVRFLAQCLQVADRADVLLVERPGRTADELIGLLEDAPAGQFAPRAVALLGEVLRRRGLSCQQAEDGWGWLAGDAGAWAGSTGAASYLDMLVHVIDFRSRHTVTHTVTTARVAHELALRMLSDDDAVKDTYLGALLHDVGKIGIPLSVLEKPGKLDSAEMAVMRAHVAMTEGILAGQVSRSVANVAVRHHEKLDGSGYPCGIREERLTMPERIVAVADIVSALVGTRSYKSAYSKERVLSILADSREGGLIDARVVDIMTRDYDDIMRSVEVACRPVEATFQRVQDGYRWLLDKLEETRTSRG